MLKALELNGFKSFADESRFEFPPGITVVVGPNGSGKSNIVDAMKWVLGEQSARSLRGKEMADVIFKGSGSGSRKPANTAEATIIFDNSSKLLGVDTTEVRVTRRVYRSGEGEYLINGQACRLRDIKDMFRGTGVGTDAYSLIEQGKVDSLLQASAKDRRAIFEEAAGISRFKAKKIEAQRRLDRVEQNLLRLSDIVDEVDNRLRRLKSQAGKARRYKEYADRLQALRTQVGRVDWQQMSERLEVVDAERESIAEAREQRGAALQVAEAEAAELETKLAALDETLRERDADSASNRERIATLRTTIEHERSRLYDFEDELSRHRRQLLAMTSRAGDLQSQWKESSEERTCAEQEHHKNTQQLEREQQALELAVQELDQAKQQAAEQRSEYLQGIRTASELTQHIATFQSQLDAAETTRERMGARLEELQITWDQVQDETQWLGGQLEKLESSAAAIDVELREARRLIKSLAAQFRQAEQEHSDCRERRAVIGERITVLEEIESRMEGVGSGVQQLLVMAREHPSDELTAIRGMVADLIQVPNRDDAPMIAAALGERAQHIVIAGTKLIDHISDGSFLVPGRVGFVRLQSAPPPRFLRDVDLEGQSGVIGRADRLVTSTKEYSHLVDWLLGDTWLVETLHDAVQYHRSLTAPPRLVTRNGEVLDRDGRLIVGPPNSELQLIPRRAELDELRMKLEGMDADVQRCERSLGELAEQRADLDERLEDMSGRSDVSHRGLAEARLNFNASEKRLTDLQQQREEAIAEQSSAEQQSEQVSGLLANVQTELAEIQTLNQDLEIALNGYTDRLADLEAVQQRCAKAVTSAQVVLAKSEQHYDALTTRCQQLQRDQQERERALRDAHQQSERTEERRMRSEQDVLRATSELAERFLFEEQAAREVRSLLLQRSDLREQRTSLSSCIGEFRAELQQLEQRNHTQEMDAERIRRERVLLAERLQEDYGIDVASLGASLSLEEEQERAEVDAEIAELRRKIANLGSVNMDALEELTDLESRHSSLASQYQDLVDAKESLERIIQKINSDSRRLFSETLEAIRANFQVLFRKVFGGGSADIVLEQDADILEAGIDIVATPPGKHSLGLSLLSGGERALTAVTLLMAIFQYRPSPFCVLDEVDGPLDEANIGRFLDVLRDFLEWTKFVVVTHSKKTMTAAHTLYGVTMQESGVSKRVSVRFEDVSENGEISQSAIERSAASSGGSADRGVA